PTAGPPPHFKDYDDYQEFIHHLIETNITDDPTKVYWDIRLSERFPTVEFRVADMCSTVDETVMVAGIIRALCQTCYQDFHNKTAYPEIRSELLKAGMWQAARYGIEGELIDFKNLRSVAATDSIQSLLSYIRPALDDHGDWDTVSQQVNRIFTHGNSAQRQRHLYQTTGNYHTLVDYLVEQTKQGIV
ncbi:MAG: carboxylate-amine ligase, partial [Elainellaceae cyanobacterium]